MSTLVAAIPEVAETTPALRLAVDLLSGRALASLSDREIDQVANLIVRSGFALHVLAAAKRPEPLAPQVVS